MDDHSDRLVSIEFRRMAREGIEPPTRIFSPLLTTNTGLGTEACSWSAVGHAALLISDDDVPLPALSHYQIQ